MRKTVLFFLVAALSVLLIRPVFAELTYNANASDGKPATMSFLEGSQQHVSIDLRESDIVDVLKFLSQKGRFNIFISPKVVGRVTLYLQDVRIADILDIILLSNGLSYHEKNNIVYILTQEEYKARYGQDYGDAREVQMIHLKYASPAQVFKMLEPTKSTVGSIVVDEQTGTIILIEISERLRFMLKVIQELDQPVGTRTFDLSYAKAADVQTLLSAKLGTKGIDSISADTRSNQVVVTALPDRMKEIEEMIRSLDRKTREVAIDTRIVKVILSDARTQGINWSHVYAKGILEPLSLSMTLSQSLTTGGSFTYSQGQFSEVFQYLQTLGESKILASPRITVIEGEEAKILIGTRQAYVTSTTTTGSSTSTVSESISFVDVGISLSVSALINKEGYVTMKVKPEVSSVSSTLTTTSGNKIPIVDTTQAETRVMVKDGTTIVIGGLRKDEKSLTRRKVPILGDIPLLGHVFFRDDSNTLGQTELVVFLTPKIIEGDKNVLEDAQKPDAKGIQAYPDALSRPQKKEIFVGDAMGAALKDVSALKAYPEKKG